MCHRAHLEQAVGHSEPHCPAKITANGFSHQREIVRREGLPRRDKIALAHLDGAGRSQGREHAGSSRQPGRDAPGLRSLG